MTPWTRFSNPCDPGLLVPGKQVRFAVDDQHHMHGCVETVLYGGAWVRLDNGEKLFVQKGKMLVENPVRGNPTPGLRPGQTVWISYPDSVEQLTVVERGTGGRNVKASWKKKSLYVVRDRAGDEFVADTFVLFTSPEAAAIASAEMRRANPTDSNPTGGRWAVRYVHQISPSPKDVGPSVTLPDGAFSNSKTLGAALREAGVLMAGGRVRDFRVEGDRVVVFPSVPGLTTYWHSIILTHEGS